MTRDKRRTTPSRVSSAAGNPVVRQRWWAIVRTALFLTLLFPRSAGAEQAVRLKSGMVIRGTVVEIPGVNQSAFALASATAENRSLPVWMIDDGLRRTYVHKNGMVAQSSVVEDLAQRIEIWQAVPVGGRTIGGMGPLLGISDFNDYGQRAVTVRGTDGSPISLLQGITEVNARYAKLEALRSTPIYQWQSRVATSSIPADQLAAMFARRIDRRDYGKRLEVVRLYIEAERFGEARAEMEMMIREFPDEPRLATQLKVLAQSQGTQLLREAKLRRDAGQYQLALQILDHFPLAEVARVTAIEVQDTIDSIRGRVAGGQQLVEQLRGQIRELGEAYPQGVLLAFADEIEQGLSPDSLNRLNDYSQLGGVADLPVENRVALAIGGWLLGPGSGLQNLTMAVSLIDVRDRARQYLSTLDAVARDAVLEDLRQIEGGSADNVARIVRWMTPPLELPTEAQDESDPGLYRMPAELTGRQRGSYVVQLPPEYDPLRQYPCIVALHPIGSTAESQIDYWSGPWQPEAGMRMGQGARHGFVVVAPAWTRPGQLSFEATPREHAEVLAALRDAMRRISIDSDRVFLVGLADGGSAAWDIAQAHPDLWAGMINIGGDPSSYARHYAANLTRVPMRFVFGEIAGTPAPLVRMGDRLDRYMKTNFNAMVITYRGRGAEHFYEEIHQHFDWMRLPTMRRGDPPTSIEAVTMRVGDQFFWWLELDGLLDQIVIDPFLWDLAESPSAAEVAATVGSNNEIRIRKAPARAIRVFLEPSMGVRLDQRVTIRHQNRRATVEFDGSADFLLEDVRTRADRKRPFWTYASLP